MATPHPTDCFNLFPDCWTNYANALSYAWNGSGTDCAGNVYSGAPDVNAYDQATLGASYPLPFAFYTGASNGTMAGIAAGRQYNYVSVSNISTCVPVIVEMWGKAGIVGLTPGVTTPTLNINGNIPGEVIACPGMLKPIGCGVAVFPDFANKNVFDTNGDSTFGFGKWGKIAETAKVTDDGTTQKYRIGASALTFPNVPDAPCKGFDESTHFASSSRGFALTDVKAVARWKFTQHYPADPNWN